MRSRHGLGGGPRALGLAARLGASALAAPRAGAASRSSISPRWTASSTRCRAEYLRGAIARGGRRARPSLVVITLRTPGGLVDSTRDINTAIIAARTPVVVFVGPSGSRAASAGFLITIAADVAAMAPGTHIGAAHPVSGDGEKVDEVMAKKMASDVAGYARTIATQRRRNVSWSSRR